MIKKIAIIALAAIPLTGGALEISTNFSGEQKLIETKVHPSLDRLLDKGNHHLESIAIQVEQFAEQLEYAYDRFGHVRDQLGVTSSLIDGAHMEINKVQAFADRIEGWGGNLAERSKELLDQAERIGGRALLSCEKGAALLEKGTEVDTTRAVTEFKDEMKEFEGGVREMQAAFFELQGVYDQINSLGMTADLILNSKITIEEELRAIRIAANVLLEVTDDLAEKAVAIEDASSRYLSVADDIDALIESLSASNKMNAEELSLDAKYQREILASSHGEWKKEIAEYERMAMGVITEAAELEKKISSTEDLAEGLWEFVEEENGPYARLTNLSNEAQKVMADLLTVLEGVEDDCQAARDCAKQINRARNPSLAEVQPQYIDPYLDEETNPIADGSWIDEEENPLSDLYWLEQE